MLKFVRGGYRGGGRLAGCSCCLFLALVLGAVVGGLVPLAAKHPVPAGVILTLAALFFYSLRSR